jgi:hypothetical protein
MNIDRPPTHKPERGDRALEDYRAGIGFAAANAN